MPMDFPHELLEDRVVILPDPVEKYTSSGIYMPESAKPKANTGIVVGFGKGYYARDTGVLIPLWVKKGDWVKYNKNEFERCDISGFENLIFGRETSIVCILNKT